MLAEARRLIAAQGDWAAMRAGFRWPRPERFNIARACCDDWAAVDPDREAIRHLHEDGGRRDLELWPAEGGLGPAGAVVPGARCRRGRPGGGAAGAVARGDGGAFRGDEAGGGGAAAVHPVRPRGAGLSAGGFGGESGGHRCRECWQGHGADARSARSGARSMSPVPRCRRCCRWRPRSARRMGRLDAVDTLAEDPAVLIYTSGTTGPPKGVLHAHRFLIGHLPSMETVHEGFPQPGDRGWTPADWAWIGGLMDMAMPCLYYGVPQVSCRMRKFDPDGPIALIRDEGVRNVFLPPTALKLMRQAPVPRGWTCAASRRAAKAWGPGCSTGRGARWGWCRTRSTARPNAIWCWPRWRGRWRCGRARWGRRCRGSR